MRSLAVLLLALAVVACIPRTAEVGTTTSPSESTITTTIAAPGTSLAEFATCMREAGFEVGDLALDSTGTVDLGSLAASADPSAADMRAALASCSVILWRAGLLTLSSDPGLQAAVIDRLETFAACMRGEGFATFPDPDTDFTGAGAAFPVDRIPYAQPGFRQASGTCAATISTPDSG